MADALPPNQVTCLNCGETLTSAHRHNHVRCGCKDDAEAIWIDGGHDYYKRSFGPHSRWSEWGGKVFVGGVEVRP